MPEPNGQSRCGVRVYDGVYGYRECPNRVKVERNGKGYCGVHDPLAIKRRTDARAANHEARTRKWSETIERSCAEHAACAGVATEDLRPGLVAELLAASRMISESR